MSTWWCAVVIDKGRRAGRSRTSTILAQPVSSADPVDAIQATKPDQAF